VDGDKHGKEARMIRVEAKEDGVVVEIKGSSREILAELMALSKALNDNKEEMADRIFGDEEESEVVS
jgi:hypothetical protein